MNSFQELVSSRRSIRKLDSSKEIPAEVLDKILQAGIDAPTAKNNQPFHIYVIRSKEAKEKLQSCYQGRWFADATLYLLIVGEEEKAWHFKDELNSSVYIDGAIVGTHMMLQAWDEGVGSTWVCAFDRLKCCELFGLEMGVRTPLSILALGYPCENPATLPHIRQPKDHLVTEL